MTWVLAIASICTALGLGALLQKIFPARLSKDDRIDNMQKRFDKLEASHNLQADYIFELRAHIAGGLPPPPPPFPEGMKI